MSRLGTARPEDTPRHQRARCLARVAGVAGVAARTAPAGTCLRPTNRAAIGHLLAMLVDLAKHPEGVLRSPRPVTRGGIGGDPVALTAVLVLGKPRHRGQKRVLTIWGGHCPSRRSSSLL